MGKLFGGGATKASKQSQQATREDNRRRQDFVERQAGQARQDLLTLIGAGINPQIQAMQAGNVAAQEQLVRGLPQIQSALLGQAVDYSQFQPQQIDVQTDFLPTTQSQAQPAPQNPFSQIANYGFNFGGRR